MKRVVFVCLGNICRSPMAEAVFRHLVAEKNLSEQIAVDSAGTSDWHRGESAHAGTRRELARHQIPADNLVSRPVDSHDFETADYLVAMDRSVYRQLLARGAPRHKLLLFMDLLPEIPGKDVPDPYYTGDFAEVYQLIEQGCRRLLESLADGAERWSPRGASS
ncbi:MAG: low molecular weight phosphotyrosine protein phosphatase [Firmicutes bacterium]|nr:low molecular weight phosphotyrosine protein phosphatase [Bacillota bacterium]